MAFGREHPLAARWRGRNLGVGLALLSFAAVVFAITVAKLSSGQMIEGFDHAVRPSITVPAE
jgi:hypothetical protein